MIILGIDPGIATTGYGIIANYRGKLSLISFGCILTSKNLTLPQRLKETHADLTKLIKKHKPEILVVESVYFSTNAKTAISVAESRGVVLLAGEQNKLKILEFTPLQVKNRLTGYGKAEKKQVQYMVQKMLGLESIPKPDDAADALALAICGSNSQ